jgi:hypothetical protein
MEIQKLQQAWNQLSSIQASKNELGENEIREMLNSRTKNTIERIDRNIRLGSLVLLLIIVFLIINEVFISPMVIEGIDQELKVPVWSSFLDVVVNLLIIILFSLFVYRYFQVKRSCLISCDLRNTLNKIIRILNIYKRLFNLALIVFLLSSIPGFISGLYEGIVLNDIPGQAIPGVVIAGILILFIITGCLFFLFRWGFRRLYGNYLKNLKQTLKELDELD